MLRIRLTPTMASSVRFVVSPLFEAGVGLQAARGRLTSPEAVTWAQRGRRCLMEHRLHLLAALVLLPQGYMPDFLNPHPDRYAPDVETELDLVARTPAGRVRGEMLAMATGRPRAGLPGALPHRHLLDALEQGETAFAQRAADELHQFWQVVVAPHWAAVRRRIDDDVERRAGQLARHGLGALWPTIGQGITWHAGTLWIPSPYEVDVTWGDSLILAPSTITDRLVTGIDPANQRSTYLIFPALTTTRATPSPDPMAGVVGDTRSRLLAALSEPLTTTALSRRVGLSPATVSYHLGRLHAAGLVARSRHGRHVTYRVVDRLGSVFDPP